MDNALKPWNYAISANADTSKYLQLMAQIIYKMNALTEPINRLHGEVYSVYDVIGIDNNQYVSKLNEYKKLLNEYQGLQNEYDLILTCAIHHDNQNINKHNHKWIQLSSLPGTPFSNAVKINEYEFIFAIYNEHQLLNYNAIYCYNTHTNKWRKFLTYPPSFSIAQDSPISYNTNKKELYLCNGLITDQTNDIWNANPMFAKININADDPDGDNNPDGDNKSEWTFFEASRQEFASGSLMIDGDLHLFGGCNNTTHRSYNIIDDFDDEKHSKHDDAIIEKKCIYDFGEKCGNEWVLGNVQHGLVYDESQKRIILFGGMNIPNYPTAFDMFWDFDLVKKKWRRLTDLRLPYKMYGFGHVLSADQGVIITFGGGRERNNDDGSGEFGYEFMDEIYVIDINKKVIKQSEIKCPLKGIYHAISMIDDNKILKNGFLRECMKEYEMNFPLDLRNLMGLFYVEEYVHILHRETCRHWKINITEIIDNCY